MQKTKHLQVFFLKNETWDEKVKARTKKHLSSYDVSVFQWVTIARSVGKQMGQSMTCVPYLS